MMRCPEKVVDMHDALSMCYVPMYPGPRQGRSVPGSEFSLRGLPVSCDGIVGSMKWSRGENVLINGRKNLFF